MISSETENYFGHEGRININKITWFIFARDAQIFLPLPRHVYSLFERWIHAHSATYRRSLYPQQHAVGLLCPLVRWGKPSKHFPSNVPTKRNRWGSDLGTVEASVSVLLDRSTDHETSHQLNYERDDRSVVVRHHAGTTCVLRRPEERTPAVLAVPRPWTRNMSRR
jgi:hypothetical protein